MFEDYFSFQVFLIVLRETLELAIIISVLLAFIHKSLDVPEESKRVEVEAERLIEESNSNELEPVNNTRLLVNYLKLQVWIGGICGLVLCLIIGVGVLSIFYLLGNDLWSITEHYWEGTFSIIASIIISIMGVKILRVNKMKDKWERKLTMLIKDKNYLHNALEHADKTISTRLRTTISVWSEKYAMFILPFITTLREGMEAIVFIGGIGINEDTSIWAIVDSSVVAVIIGAVIGSILYRSGNTLSLQWFLITSTCFLYLVAAGLFSKGIWHFELQRFINLCDGFDVSETGHGPGSYDIKTSVWHVNCCNGELEQDGTFWMMATAIFGWTNSATYGSVIGYIVYWICIVAMFESLMFEEKNGYLKYIPIKWQQKRINKRLLLLEHPENSSTFLPRQSSDSVNSRSPLND